MQAREPGYGGEERDYYTDRPSSLTPLSHMEGWDVTEGEPDIRGWKVMDKNNDQIGTVEDLIVDTDAYEAVFTEISYGGTLGAGATHTLVPMDKVHIDRDNKLIHLDADRDYIMNAPHYKKDEHRDFGQWFDYWSGMGIHREAATEAPRETGYQGRREVVEERVIPEMEEHLEVGKVEEKVGEVHIHKEVEVHPETVRGTVRRTRVHVFRRAVEPGRQVRPGEQVLREGESITIPVVEEHLTGTKRSEITGEVVIEPETVSEEKEITADVRKEHIRVETEGDVELDEEEEQERLHRGI